MKKLLLILSIFLFVSTTWARPARFVSRMGATSGPDWTPASLTGLLVWLDASDATSITIATGVSNWNDKSLNNRDAVQGVGANQPAYNGTDTITFDTTDYLTLAGTEQTFDVFFVATSRNSSAEWRSMFTSQSGAQYPFILESVATRSGVFSGSFLPSGTSWANNTRRQARLNSVSKAVKQSYDGGSLTATLTTFASAPWPDTICNHPTNGHLCDRMHEIIITSTVTEAEVTAIHAYLADKWGVN